MAQNDAFSSDFPLPANYAEMDLTNRTIKDRKTLIQTLREFATANNQYVWIADILIRLNLWNRTEPSAEAANGGPLHSGDLLKRELKPDVKVLIELACRKLETLQLPQSIVIYGGRKSGKTDTMMRSVADVMRRYTEMEASVISSLMADTDKIVRMLTSSKMLLIFKAVITKQKTEHFISSCKFVNLWLNRDLRNAQSVADVLNTFDLFRVLLFGASPIVRQLEKLNLINTANIPPVNSSQQTELATAFGELNASLIRIGIPASEMSNFWSFASAILHISTVKLDSQMQLTNEDSWEFFCERLGEQPRDLFTEITQKWRIVKGNKVPISVKTPDEVNSDLRGIAAYLYSKLVNWVIDKINATFQNCTGVAEGAQQAAADSTSFLILDVPSLTVDQSTSFGADQLALGVISDHLENYYDETVFLSEEAALKAEKIPSSKKPRNSYRYPNCPVTELYFKEKYSLPGLIGKAKNASQLEKSVLTTFKHSDAIEEGDQDSSFVVNHFAGTVQYNTPAILRGNSIIPQSIIHKVHSSTNEFWTAVLAARDFPKEQGYAEAIGEFVENETPEGIINYAVRCARMVNSILGRTKPYFIRCINTNGQSKPLVIDEDFVLRQLQVGRVFETLQMRTRCFGTVVDFSYLMKCYGLLAYPATELPMIAPTAATCQNVLLRGGATKDTYAIGLTKVFMKNALVDLLDEQLKRRGRFIFTIQRMCRRYLAKKSYSLMKKQEQGYTGEKNRLLEKMRNLTETVQNFTVETTQEDREFREDKYLKPLIRKAIDTLRLPASEKQAGGLSRLNNWGHLLYLEYGSLVCSFDLYNNEMEIDNTSKSYDMRAVGYGSCCTASDQNLATILNDPSFRIQISKQKVGDLQIKVAAAQCKMRVHGCSPERVSQFTACASAELATRFGELLNNVQTTVFDTSQFASLVALFLKEENADVYQLLRQCCSIVQIVPKRTDGASSGIWPLDLFDTPAWFLLVDLAAMTMLESERFLGQVADAILDTKLYGSTKPKHRWAREIHEHNGKAGANGGVNMNPQLTRLLFREKIAEVTMNAADRELVKQALQADLEKVVEETTNRKYSKSEVAIDFESGAQQQQSADQRRSVLFAVGSKQHAEFKKTLRRGTARSLAQQVRLNGGRSWAKVLYSEQQVKNLYNDRDDS